MSNVLTLAGRFDSAATLIAVFVFIAVYQLVQHGLVIIGTGWLILSFPHVEIPF